MKKFALVATLATAAALAITHFAKKKWAGRGDAAPPPSGPQANSPKEPDKPSSKDVVRVQSLIGKAGELAVVYKRTFVDNTAFQWTMLRGASPVNPGGRVSGSYMSESQFSPDWRARVYYKYVAESNFYFAYSREFETIQEDPHIYAEFVQQLQWVGWREWDKSRQPADDAGYRIFEWVGPAEAGPVSKR